MEQRSLPKLCCSIFFVLVASQVIQAQQYRTLKVSYAQKEEKQLLSKVLNQLNRVKGIFFLIADKSVADIKVFPVKDIHAETDSILNEIFMGTNLTYKKADSKTYIIIPKKEVSNINYPSAGEDSSPGVVRQADVMQQVVHGIVTGTNGRPVEKASVFIKGTKKGTTTNASGEFFIEVLPGQVLVISYVGYLVKEITIGDTAGDLKVMLDESIATMSNVVVTALGIKRQQRSLGYSTTEIDGSKFTQSRETNIGNALTGQVAGVSVAGIATGPSGSSRVVIRGNASLKGNNQPLYVIDGVPFDNSNQGFAGAYGGSDFGDGLSAINPDDIENIQVLKGVAASALYGYRGGNGAILITTKSGSRNKGVGVEVNNNLTANTVVDLRKDLQFEYGQGYDGNKPVSQYGASSSSQGSWGAKLDGSMVINFDGLEHPYSAYKNNFKNFFETGLTNQTSVALTGGNDKGHFRLGLSNLNLSAVIPNSNMEQQGINFNSAYDITSRLHLTLNANYAFEKVKNRASVSDAPGNLVATAYYLATSFDIRWLKKRVDENGVEILPNVDDPYTNNPYFVAYDFQNRTNRQRLTGGLTLKYDFTSWLSLQAQVTRDGYILDRTEITPTGTQFLYGDNGFLTQTKTDYHELNTNFLLEANKEFGALSLHANVGGNSEDNVYVVGGIYGAGPFQVPYFYSASNIVDKPFEYSYAHKRVNSIYGSADVGYKNYLFLSLTARNDWYSTLNPGSNHFLYPSVSSSFIFSDVVKMPSWINFGKLRASFAQSSNGTDPYQNLLTYRLEGYSINGQPIGNINQAVIPNKNLEPVKISEAELGINLQFLQDRAGIDIAVYNKETEDDILDVASSSSSGYLGNLVNIGKLRNRGIELLLTGTPIKTKNFSWSPSFNIALNDNKVLALAPPDNTPVPVNDDNYPRWGDFVSIQHIVGKPYAQIVGYAYKRNSEGKIVYDADGYPLQSDVLPVPLGSAIYKTTGGFNNDFRYKNFILSFLVDFKYGAKIYSGTNLLLYSNGQHIKTLQGRETGYIGPGVTEDNKANTISVPAQTYFYQVTTGDHQVAEEFVYDASFIKLRSLSVGYSIPQAKLKNGFIKGFAVSLVARNLAILMKHTPNIDPESNVNGTNAQGLELAGYPSVRSMGVNVNVRF